MKYRRIAAALILAATCARAQDKATLDLLVRKGLITREEADGLMQAKDSEPAPVTTKNNVVKSVTVGAVLQARYLYAHIDDRAAPGPADSNGFMARRLIFFVGADFGGGFSATLSPEFDMTRGASQQAYLNLAVLRHTSDYGVAEFGFRKVNFALEEYVSPPATANLAPEYSAATWRLASTGFASRHLGIFWDGKIPGTGWIYGAAVTNSQQDLWNPGGTSTPGGSATPGNNSNNNEPALWANVAYAFDPAQGVKTNVGLNTGRIGDTGTALADIIGYNPFVRVDAGRATFIAEMMGWYANAHGASDAQPLGANVTGAYRITGTIEPVIRYSLFRGDGLRTPVSGVVQGASNTASTYDHADSIYAGFNWYIRKDNLKVQTGYEFTHLSNPAAGTSEADAHALRTQLQMVF